MTTENYRHVFLYYKNRVSWPPRFDSSDADPLPKLFISTWKSDMDNMTIKAKIYVCEVNEDPTRYYTKIRGDFSDGDVLIFPDMIKYRGLVESNVESFFEDVLVNSKPWSAGVPEVLTGVARTMRYILLLVVMLMGTKGVQSFSVRDQMEKLRATVEQIKRSFANVKRVDHEKLANGESTNKGAKRLIILIFAQPLV
ncbi:hypothetical protein OROGR_027262 [Orobanche gracilis]